MADLDYNYDGKVDAADISIDVDHWLTICDNDNDLVINICEMELCVLEFENDARRAANCPLKTCDFNAEGHCDDCVGKWTC